MKKIRITNSKIEFEKVFEKYCLDNKQTFADTNRVYKHIARGGHTMSKTVGYARVSTREQNLDRQIAALREYVSDDMIVTDKSSGKDLNRAGYQ